MYKLILIATSLWLVFSTPTIQASSDSGYLGMGGWNTTTPTVIEPDETC